MSSPPLIRANLGVIGDAEVGKTALLKAFEQKHFFQHQYVQSVSLRDPTQSTNHRAPLPPPKCKVELYAIEVGGHTVFTVQRNKYVRGSGA
jgi:GTPase SAR1 family protein